MKITQKQMISKIREAVGQCEGDEKDVLECLMDESDNWNMRLQELKEEE
jgi:hypothetical protein